MNLQDLGNIGELISGIAVVFSLIYVAYQIRQNTEQTNQNTQAVRAAAMDSSISWAINARQTLYQDQELVRIYMQGNEDPHSLPELELVQYRLLLQNIMWAFWNMYSQGVYTGLNIGVWHAQGAVIRRIYLSKGGQWFWEHYQQEFEIAFREEIERVLAEGD